MYNVELNCWPVTWMENDVPAKFVEYGTCSEYWVPNVVGTAWIKCVTCLPSNGTFYAFSTLTSSIAWIFAAKKFTVKLYTSLKSSQRWIAKIATHSDRRHRDTVYRFYSKRKKKWPWKWCATLSSHVTNLMDIMQCRQIARQADVCKFTQCIVLYGAERASHCRIFWCHCDQRTL